MSIHTYNAPVYGRRGQSTLSCCRIFYHFITGCNKRESPFGEGGLKRQKYHYLKFELPTCTPCKRQNTTIPSTGHKYRVQRDIFGAKLFFASQMVLRSQILILPHLLLNAPYSTCENMITWTDVHNSFCPYYVMLVLSQNNPAF